MSNVRKILNVVDLSQIFDQYFNSNENGLVRLRNPNLKSLDHDFLYHLELGTNDHDFVKMFGDVKFICTGGTAIRMKNFINSIEPELSKKLKTKLEIWQHSSSRYSMYKVGPVLAVNHGIGVPSLQILLNELFKLMYYAKMKNPVIFRIGTCGGVGITPGTVVITNEGVDEEINPYFVQVVLGKKIHLPATLDRQLVRELKALVNSDDPYDTIIGKTMCTSDFYEGQGRLDGAFCKHTIADKMDYLAKLQEAGVVNIEMECTAFAALTYQAGIKAGICCVAMLDRFKGDQIRTSNEVRKQWELRPQDIISRYILRHL
ncbi:PREDICTED: uridine phosphorylase 1-like [Ceratosolen solmsi marchali]|uniref:Uridine phosphorylase 1-like n=1 Tax=Ceratosolen solmsi marchali TaxID=326594 RepID=A0AAJ6YGH2_9HYME|nr:PREDICTED: uridine phosphorylase 1-like [Ceratosolen solmsi marchali]